MTTRHDPDFVVRCTRYCDKADRRQVLGRYRAAEFRKFLGEIEAAVPDDLAVHLAMDDYVTRKMPLIRKWFSKRPH
jgi:hypothetical protein